MSSENTELKPPSKLKALLSHKRTRVLFVLSFILLGGTIAGVFYTLKKNEKINSVVAEKSDKKDEGKENQKEELLVDGLSEKKRSLASYFKLKTYLQALESIETKAGVIHQALEENQKLKIENSALRQWAEEIKFECTQAKSVTQTDLLANRLKQETGTEIGRVLASINYHPPTHLLPSQLGTLGLTYFRTEDYEKSAVIMTYITGLYNDHSFKNPKYYLVTALSWYYLNNYLGAIEYFNKAIESDSVAKNVDKFKSQAYLGLVLTYEKMKNKKDSQYWARELVARFPRSDESKWINPKGELIPEKLVERLPASLPKELPEKKNDEVKNE